MTSARRRQRCPSRVSSTAMPVVGELVSQPVGRGPIARRACGGSRVEQGPHIGRQGLLGLGEDPEHPVEVAKRRQRASGVGGREPAGIDPTIELADEVVAPPPGRPRC